MRERLWMVVNEIQFESTCPSPVLSRKSFHPTNPPAPPQGLLGLLVPQLCICKTWLGSPQRPKFMPCDLSNSLDSAPRPGQPGSTFPCSSHPCLWPSLSFRARKFAAVPQCRCRTPNIPSCRAGQQPQYLRPCRHDHFPALSRTGVCSVAVPGAEGPTCWAAFAAARRLLVPAQAGPRCTA